MIETRWALDQQLVRHRCDGEVNLADLLKALADTVHDERFADVRASLWDLRDGKFELDYDGLVSMSPIYLRFTREANPPRAVAWVVNHQFTGSVIELFYRTYPWPSTWRVFQSMNAADQWCRQAGKHQPPDN